MTLVTTPGSASADSYASLAAALAYHAAVGNTVWASSTDALREPALRRATAWVDGTFRVRWPGFPFYGRVQALDWPRVGVADPHGYVVDYLTVPVEIVNATCEAALRELVTPGSLAPDYVEAEQVATATAGPVSVTFKGTGRSGMSTGGVGSVVPILTVVDGILSRLLGPWSRNTVTLLRA